MTSNGYQESMVLPKVDKYARMFVGLLFLCSAFTVIFCITGIYQTFISIPDKNVEISELTSQLNVWQARAKELDRAVQEYKVAMNFEKLFLLVAKSDSVMLMGELQKLVENKAEFCLGDHRELELRR